MAMMEKVLMLLGMEMQANRFKIVLIILCFIVGARYWCKDIREMIKTIRCKGSSILSRSYAFVNKTREQIVSFLQRVVHFLYNSSLTHPVYSKEKNLKLRI